MSEIVAIAKNADCNHIGGQELAYATEYTNVTAVTVGTGASAGIITGFTMASTGLWGKLQFDDENNVAFFNEEGQESTNSILVNGTGLMKFNGISQAKITAANKAKDCCGLVIIWVGYDGVRRVEGIEVNPTTNAWAFSKRLPRIVPNVLSDTGENAGRMEYNVTHQGRQFSPTTNLSNTAIEAL